MRASFEDYSFVAHLCNSYNPDNPNGAITGSIGDHVSCLNCRYLQEDGRCDLDLYDKIMDYNSED
jgi:hypothetical protein